MIRRLMTWTRRLPQKPDEAAFEMGTSLARRDSCGADRRGIDLRTRSLGVFMKVEHSPPGLCSVGVISLEMSPRWLRGCWQRRTPLPTKAALNMDLAARVAAKMVWRAHLTRRWSSMGRRRNASTTVRRLPLARTGVLFWCSRNPA